MNSYLESCRNVQNIPIVMWFTSSVSVSLVIWVAHYLSGFLTVGSMVMLDLRVLGFTGKDQTITEVSEFYSPWMWIGLAVLSVTGILMLAGESADFCTNGVFGINLLLTAVAATSGVFVRKSAPTWDQPSGPPLGAKVLVGFSILLWVGTILSAVEVPSLTSVP